MLTCLAVCALLFLGLVVVAAAVQPKTQPKLLRKSLGGSTASQPPTTARPTAPPPTIPSPSVTTPPQAPSVWAAFKSGFNDGRGVRPTEPAQSRWVPYGEQVSVRGYQIPGGLIYFGSGHASLRSEHEVEPALIDPTLDVDSRQPDRFGSGMPYWPSYSTISPAQRAGYLEWLAGGRRDPQAYIGYVFIFFYGLERRVLADLDREDADRAELPLIAAELERLLAIYTSSNSFQRYASRLIDVALARPGAALTPAHVRPRAGSSEHLPLALRWQVGCLAAAGSPLPVEWAIAWIDSDPSMPMRTPTRRCRAEFETLFRHRYASQHSTGIHLRACHRRLTAELTPASASFGQRVISLSFDVPDVTVLVAPTRALHALVEECSEALEPLSRRRARQDRSSNGLSEAALMPRELLGAHLPKDVEELRQRFHDALGGREFAVVTAGEMLVGRFPDNVELLPKGEAIDLLRSLQCVGLGIEPDLRFGGPSVGRMTRIVVFRLESDSMNAPSDDLSAASLLVRLGVSVAASDGTIHETERRHLHEHASSSMQLDDSERLRLRAQVEWLADNPPDLGKLKKRLQSLPEPVRHQAGRFVIGVALADGSIDATEVKSLTKIYRLLGLDEARVHTDLHEAQVVEAADGLVRFPSTGPRGIDVPIPAQPQEAPERKGRKTAARSLDMAAVEAKKRESAQVAAMLGAILAAEDETPAVVAANPTAEARCIRSLDGKHTRFLLAVGERSTVARDELDRLAGEAGLMPDGAMDVLNELAFDVCGDALFEGEDPIELNETVYKELIA